MKTIKFLTFVSYGLTVFLLGLGCLIYFIHPVPTFNFNFLLVSICLVAIVLAFITPIFISTVLNDTLFRTQEEIDNLKRKYSDAVLKMNKRKGDYVIKIAELNRRNRNNNDDFIHF
jgi:uncharacterized membrane protein (DUF106 family)